MSKWQKIVVWIPIVNLLALVFWSMKCIVLGETMRLVRPIFVAAIVFVAGAILRAITTVIFSTMQMLWVVDIVEIVTLYMSVTIVAAFLARTMQEI